MRISRTVFAISLLGLGWAGLAPAQALDPSLSSGFSDKSSREIFSLGYGAYQRGEKEEAFDTLNLAAERGHAGARWKLGQMYATGDGVAENDYEAFKMFERIVRDQGEDGAFSQNRAYIASAVVALAQYIRDGIPGSPIAADPVQARQLFSQAASYYGEPHAQFELGRMLLRGEGGSADPRQAARWLQLAARKGHVKAQALLGYLLFDGVSIQVRPEPVKGLAMLTRALRDATPVEREWIRPLQEEAFSLSSEDQRRTALASAERVPAVQ
jgi:uncharacterized protein